jgi:hypothetical protein
MTSAAAGSQAAQRLVLKRPSGWFAAGHEVAQALELLSDAAFKLFVYFCLNADRHTGRIAIGRGELSSALGKDVTSIHAAVGELERCGVCLVEGDAIDINDRFWPYQKRAAPSTDVEQAEFVRQVRAVFLAPARVQSAFTAADEKLAIALYRRSVSIEHAIWLGCARKYTAMLNHQTRQAITSLAYFGGLIDEVIETGIPDRYWKYVRRKAEQLDRSWLETLASAGGRK